MNLKNKFAKAHKGNGSFLMTQLLHTVVSLGLIFVINLVWNYLAPIWGLPVLTYLQFIGTLFLLHLLTSFLGFKATQRDANPEFVDIAKILGEPPYGKQ